MFSLDGESKQSLNDHEPSLRKVNKTHEYCIHVFPTKQQQTTANSKISEIHTEEKGVELYAQDF